MKKHKSPKQYHKYSQLERQRKALRYRLYRMIDELEGRPTNRRKYPPQPYGLLAGAVEAALRTMESTIRGLVITIEKKVRKPWDK